MRNNDRIDPASGPDRPKTYPAPALGKGIEAIRILLKEGPLGLERLAQQTRIPKASLLRIMKTLETLEVVERDASTKRFSLRQILIPLGTTGEPRFRESIRKALEHLADATGLTAEWYVPEPGTGMIITERREPIERTVRVVAKIGFVRTFHGEMDAVARIAARWGLTPSAESESDCWIYEQDGSRKRLEHEKRVALLREKGRNEADMDIFWNPHGVRRYAVAVSDRNGRLAGILALAESFTPSHEEGIDRNLDILSDAAGQLSKPDNHEPISNIADS
jgi:DNA-binding IclR family transcriptional regulator